MSSEDLYAWPLAFARGRIYRAVEAPIKVGSVLWVHTDPHRGHERAYNRWYERDHYYANGLEGAYAFAGSRWVATRPYKAVRFPTDTDTPYPPPGAGSYACVYYVTEGHHEDWLAWGSPVAHHLYHQGRGFDSRTHYNTGTYVYDWRAHRDPDPVPLELALDHRYPGLVAQFIQPADSSSAEEIATWFDGYLPGWLDESPVATVSSWSPIPLREDKPEFLLPDPGSALMQLYFYDEDPLLAWDRQRDLAEHFEKAGLGQVVYAAPFIPTVVGTDRHTDELW